MIAPQNELPTLDELASVGFILPRDVTKVIPEIPMKDQQVIGYMIQRGEKCLLSAKPKLGKSSFLRQAIRMMDAGATAPWGKDFGNIAKGRVLILSEESDTTWYEWRKTMDLKDHIYILNKRDVRNQTWPDICLYLAALVREYGFILVVIDTLSVFARIKDENSASECTLAMSATDCIVQENAALVLVHHDRKSGGADGESARGSNALVGGVATAVQMSKGNKHWCERIGGAIHYLRQFYVQSRHSYVPEYFALLRDTDGHYQRIYDDDRAEKKPTASEKQQAIIVALLPEYGRRGYDWELLRNNWPETPIPSRSTIQKALKAAEDTGDIVQDESSEGGNTNRYTLLNSATPMPSEPIEKRAPETALRVQKPTEIEKNTMSREVEKREGSSTPRRNIDREVGAVGTDIEMGMPDALAIRAERERETLRVAS